MSATPATTPAPAASPSPIDTVLAAVKGLQENQDKLQTQLTELTKSNKDRSADALAPRARTGESIMTSRGFQFSRVIGAITGKLDKGFAKVECELSERLQKEYVERGFYRKEMSGSVVVPLSSDLIAETDPSMTPIAKEIGEIVHAGVTGADPEEMRALVRKFPSLRRSLSWQDESGLGNLVGPAIMGEPIELLRNQEIFMRAGARTIPFPPSGRVTWPRFTGATSAYWVGTTTANRSITGSAPTTGDVVLQVKKLGVLVTVPNELFRFPTVSVEQLLRQDMMKTASLKLDKTFLEGDPGSTTDSQLSPKGLIQYSNLNSFTAGTTGTDGDTLEPEDILKIIATIEEQNLDMGAFVMRPQLYAAVGNRRADGTMPGDNKGMFLFNVLRELQGRNVDVTNNTVGQLEGYPVFKSNQVSKARSKGASSNLSYILAGQFEQYLIALSGVMEFAVAQQGDTIFPQDQTQIRLITWADGAPRHEEAFLLVDNLNIA